MTQPDGADTLTERIAGALEARMPAGDHGDYCRTLAAAVLTEVQQDRAELASLAVNAANALRDEKRHYEIACGEIARLKGDVVLEEALHEEHRRSLAIVLDLPPHADWLKVTRRATQKAAGRETWKAKAEEIEQDRDEWMARAEQAEAALARVREIHQPVNDRTGCDSDGNYDDIAPACSTCGSDDNAVPWPCATLTALNASSPPAP